MTQNRLSPQAHILVCPRDTGVEPLASGAVMESISFVVSHQIYPLHFRQLSSGTQCLTGKNDFFKPNLLKHLDTVLKVCSERRNFYPGKAVASW